MDFEPKDTATIVASGGGVLWLLAKLFRREMAEHRVDKANQKLIDELMSEKGKLLDELKAKETTISRLIAEKEAVLNQVAEIPGLKNQISELEAKLDEFSRLVVGMNRLMTHLLLEADLGALPEELRRMLREELPILQAGAAGV